MTRNLITLATAAALALSLSACGRDHDETVAFNPELPRSTDAPANPDRPPITQKLNPDTSDPSIPMDPSNTDTRMKDRSPPYNSGEGPPPKK